MLELTIRLIASLAIVIGLLLLLARLGARRFNGSAKAVVHVMHRQQLSKGSSVAVVSVGSRVLVLGTTEHQVSVLAELDPDELDVALALEDAVADPAEESVVAPVSEIAPQIVPEIASVVTPEELPGLAATTRGSRPGARRGTLTAVPTERRTVGKHALDVPPSTGPLAGSILSPQTWRDALVAATRGA